MDICTDFVVVRQLLESIGRCAPYEIGITPLVQPARPTRPHLVEWRSVARCIRLNRATVRRSIKGLRGEESLIG